MTRVLLVEDDKNLSFILKSSLEQMIGGYEIEVATNGKEGLEKLASGRFDVIVSDVEMPVMDGVTMVRQVRERYPDVAIVFNGYQSGADFYIKKPFLPEELDAHIQAVLKVKRSASMPEADGKDRYTIGKYSFFPSQNLLCDEDGYQRSLTPKEAKVLEMLCRRKGHLVSREEILIAIWQTADFYSSRSLDVFITKLRKYLAKDPHIGLKVQKGVGIELEDGL